MATLKIIRKRITSTKNTKKLTKAMKMISASKLRRAQKQAVEARVYNSELRKVVDDLTESIKEKNHPLLDSNSENVTFILITSDKGLCGAFNDRIEKEALTFIKKENVPVKCFSIGKKGKIFLKKNNIESDDITDINYLINEHIKGNSGKTIIAYNSFNGVGNTQIIFKQLLPVEIKKHKFQIEPLYEPNFNDLLNFSLRQLVTSNFQQAILESIASELATRMVEMEKATSNAEKLINKLTMEYNRARQTAITTELLDIVGTAEALR